MARNPFYAARIIGEAHSNTDGSPPAMFTWMATRVADLEEAGRDFLTEFDTNEESWGGETVERFRAALRMDDSPRSTSAGGGQF